MDAVCYLFDGCQSYHQHAMRRNAGNHIFGRRFGDGLVLPKVIDTIVAATIWGKIKTVVQLFMCIDYIIMPVFLDNGMEWFAVAGVVLMYLATALTIISLIDYIVRNRKALEITYK